MYFACHAIRVQVRTWAIHRCLTQGNGRCRKMGISHCKTGRGYKVHQIMPIYGEFVSMMCAAQHQVEKDASIELFGSELPKHMPTMPRRVEDEPGLIEYRPRENAV